MADVKLTQVKAGGGGIPIRGVQLFDIETPSDFTFQGQRFLRAGTLETDTALFDTSIWNVNKLLPNTQTDISSLGFVVSSDAICSIEHSDGTLVIGFNNGASGMYSSDGINWTAVPNMSSNKTRLFEITTGTNAGRLVYGVTNNSGGIITWSDDKYVTSTNSVTGVGNNVNQIVAGGNRVVATAGSTWRYSTNDDLTSWATVGGTTVNMLDSLDGMAYGNGVWVASPTISTNSKHILVSADGSSFTQYTNVFGTVDHTSGALFWDPFANLFRKIGEVSPNVFSMWTSVDGITWSAAVPVTYPVGLGLSFVPHNHQVNPINGVICANTSLTTFNVPVISYDGGLTWEYTSFFGDETGNNQTTSVPFGSGFVHAGNYRTLTFGYGLYAGLYSPLQDGDAWQDQRNLMTYVRIS